MLKAGGNAMRPLVVLTILFASASCASRDEANSSIATVNDGNGTSQWEVREEPPPSATPTPASDGPKAQDTNACSMQDGAKLAIASINGVGTEPFWNVRTEGRCVTYFTPEDQTGTRVRAKVSATDGATKWVSALRGKPFEMVTTPKPGCSDGMSDKTYPMEVFLNVEGEVRHGCAAPL
jgi:uncharacterized membrane protein